MTISSPWQNVRYSSTARAAQAGRQPADHPVVGRDLDHDPARQHPFRAVRDVHVRRDVRDVRQVQVGAAGRDQLADPPGGARRRGRLQHDDLAAAQHVGDRLGRRRDVAQVGLMIAGERGGHGDDVRVGRRHLLLRPQPAHRHRAADRDGQVRLGERRLAPVDPLDDVGVHVDAGDLEPAGGQRHRGRQPDVAEPDHGGA